MVKCPECGKEYDVSVMKLEEKKCPNCGTSLLEELPTYPHLKGTGRRKTLLGSWYIFKGNLLPFLQFLLVPLALLFLLNMFTLWQMRTISTPATAISDFSTRPPYMKLILVGILGSFISFLIQLISMGGIVRLSRDAFVGKKVNPIRGLKTVKERIIPLTGSSSLIISILFGGFLISIIRGLNACCLGLIGVLFSIILSIILLYWFLFTLPIIVLQNKGILESLSLSKKMSTSREGVFLFTIIVIWLYGILNIPATNIVNPLWSSTFSQYGLIHPFGIGMLLLSIFLQLVGGTFCFVSITTHYLRIGGETTI